LKRQQAANKPHLPGSPAYLRGIETLVKLASITAFLKSPAYLRGIETPVARTGQRRRLSVSSLPKRN